MTASSTTWRRPAWTDWSSPDRRAAQDWLYSEAMPLLACVRQSAGGTTLRRAVDLLWAAVDLAESGANFKEYEAAGTTLRDAAREAADSRAEGRAVLVLANARHFSGQFEQAYQEARQALALSEASDDALPCCWAANLLGIYSFYQSRYDEAEEFLERAIASFRACGDLSGAASALCNLSRLHLQTERPDSAVGLARQGTEMYEELGHTLKAANGHYALGLALGKNSQPTDAVAHLKQALTVFRASRQRLWEGMTLFRLAEVDLLAQRPAQAAANAEMALTPLREIGGEWRPRQRPDRPRQGPERHRPVRPRPGLLDRGAGDLRAAGVAGGGGGPGPAGAVDHRLTPAEEPSLRKGVHRSFIAVRHS